jgi:hypothetical protein
MLRAAARVASTAPEIKFLQMPLLLNWARGLVLAEVILSTTCGGVVLEA